MCKEKEYRLSDLRQLAIDDLEEAIEYNDGEFYQDMIHEIADSCTPIYSSDLLGWASNYIVFAIKEPDYGPAFDGSSTPVNIIAGNIYEWLTSELYEYVDDRQYAY